MVQCAFTSPNKSPFSFTIGDILLVFAKEDIASSVWFVVRKVGLSFNLKEKQYRYKHVSNDYATMQAIQKTSNHIMDMHSVTCIETNKVEQIDAQHSVVVVTDDTNENEVGLIPAKYVLEVPSEWKEKLLSLTSSKNE